jgi:hypothetical protein
MKNYLKPYPKEVPSTLLIGDDFYIHNPQLQIDHSFEEDRKINLSQLSLEDLLHYLFQIFMSDDPEPTYFELSLGDYIEIKDGYAVFNAYNVFIDKVLLKSDKSISDSFSRIQSFTLTGIAAIDINLFSEYADRIDVEQDKIILCTKSVHFRYLKNVVFQMDRIMFNFYRNEEDKNVIRLAYSEFSKTFQQA